jgi:hypothetical protein
MHWFIDFKYVLGLVFLITGLMKLFLSKEKIIVYGGHWAESFTEPLIKLIGVIEILCSVGIIIPRFVFVEFRVPFYTTVVMMLLMVGAFLSHLRRKEYPFLIITATLFGMALYVFSIYYEHMRSFF